MRKLVIISTLLLLSGIAYGQILKKGAIVEMHHITLNLDPDATMNQWLDFALNEYLPVWENHYNGIKSVVVKGDRGKPVAHQAPGLDLGGLEVFVGPAVDPAAAVVGGREVGDVDQRNRPSPPREQGCGKRAGRPRTGDQHVVGCTHSWSVSPLTTRNCLMIHQMRPSAATEFGMQRRASHL